MERQQCIADVNFYFRCTDGGAIDGNDDRVVVLGARKAWRKHDHTAAEAEALRDETGGPGAEELKGKHKFFF